MSNPTSSFGWVMPSSTDLVTDLPADFEVFGQAVDTSLADLKGGTTGQVLKKNTDANMDFVWGTVAGDIEGVTAGVGISGGGTSGTVTITNSMATAIDAKGDLIAGTGADTFSRLAIGTNNQVLTADSTAPTGMKWATAATGGDNWVLISQQTLSSASTFTFSGLTGYKKLFLIANNIWTSASNIQGFLRFNTDSGFNYYIVGIKTATSTRLAGSTDSEILPNMMLGGTANDRSLLSVFIDGCNGGGYKPYDFNFTGYASSQIAYTGAGIYQSTSNISTIDFTLASGTISSGTDSLKLYGVA